MKKVKIITDSCADLGEKLLKQYDIDYVKMSTVYEGKETPALLTWTEEEAHALYDMIRAGKRITTAQVTTEEFQKVFGKYVDMGYDVLYIGCASKLSGSVNTGHMTAQKMMETNREARIICIDSLNSTIGEGILAIEAAKMAADGKNIGQIATFINNVRNNVQEFATVHSLDTLRRGGRVSASSAFFGNFMGVKPIVVCDATGFQAAFKKVRGRQAAIKECISLMKENILKPEIQTVYLWHSDCDKAEVNEVADMVRAEILCKEIEIGYIGPIVGASVGPSVIGVWAFGKEVTFIPNTN